MKNIRSKKRETKIGHAPINLGLFQPYSVTSTENASMMPRGKENASTVSGVSGRLSQSSMKTLLSCQRELQDESRNIPLGSPLIVKFDAFELSVASGVFIPLRECGALLDSLNVQKNDHILDLCTGSGVIGLSILQKMHGNVTVIGIDTNPNAVGCANHNALRLGFAGVFHAQVSDVFDSLPSDQAFDVIAINPPFLDMVASDDIERAFWDHDLRVHKKFFEGLSTRLARNGRAYICQTSVGPLDKVCDMAEASGFQLKLIGRAPMFARVPEAEFFAFEIHRTN